MGRKALAIASLTLLLGLWPHAAAQPTEQVRIASWNIRHLSDGSRDDAELSEMISRFDLVAVEKAWRDSVATTD